MGDLVFNDDTCTDALDDSIAEMNALDKLLGTNMLNDLYMKFYPIVKKELLLKNDIQKDIESKHICKLIKIANDVDEPESENNDRNITNKIIPESGDTQDLQLQDFIKILKTK